MTIGSKSSMGLCDGNRREQSQVPSPLVDLLRHKVVGILQSPQGGSKVWSPNTSYINIGPLKRRDGIGMTSLVPRPFTELEWKKGPGIHCLRMRQNYQLFLVICSWSDGRTCF